MNGNKLKVGRPCYKWVSNNRQEHRGKIKSKNSGQELEKTRKQYIQRS